VLFAFVLAIALHKPFVIGMNVLAIALTFANLPVAIAERRKQVKSLGELNRPISIFPHGENR
jgi:hypothetical protein